MSSTDTITLPHPPGPDANKAIDLERQAAPVRGSSQTILQWAASFVCVTITLQTPSTTVPAEKHGIVEIMIEKQVIVFQWV